MKGLIRRALIAMLFAIRGAVVAGCGGRRRHRGPSNVGGSIKVAIVDRYVTHDLAHLTPSLFTDSTASRVIGSR
jgi:hypothetical protein